VPLAATLCGVFSKTCKAELGPRARIIAKARSTSRRSGPSATVRLCLMATTGLIPRWWNQSVIALWLGHESLDTTHMYIQADLKTKEKALGKLQPVEGGFSRFKPDDALLAFLSAL